MRKLLFIGILLSTITGFSQERTANLMVVCSTTNAKGIEFLSEGELFGFGAGIIESAHTEMFYFITSRKITNDFSITGKIGGYDISYDKPIGLDHRSLYYGITGYLKLSKAVKGFVISFGTDNTKNCTYGIGYRF